MASMDDGTNTRTNPLVALADRAFAFQHERAVFLMRGTGLWPRSMFTGITTTTDADIAKRLLCEAAAQWHPKL